MQSCAQQQFYKRYCLAMPDQAHLIYELLTKNHPHMSLLILEILEFQESSTVWLVESILGNNSRPSILEDMEFGMESQNVTMIPLSDF